MTENNLNQPFTFSGLGHQIFSAEWTKEEADRRNSRQEVKKYTHFAGAFFYYSTNPETGNPTEPWVGLAFSPFISRGNSAAGLLLFPVNRGTTPHPISVDLLEDPRRYEFFNPTQVFRVYDIDVDKISDPTYPSEARQIDPREVLAATNMQDSFRHKGWVTDPHQRARINEWFDVNAFAQDYDRIRKFVQLRQAPFNRHNSPDFGDYTYEGIKDDVVNGRILSISGKPEVYHTFVPEDLEWLEEYMRNKNI